MVDTGSTNQPAEDGTMPRTRETYETPEYVAMLRRMIRRLGKRLTDGNPEDIADAVELQKMLDDVIRQAVQGARETHGYSWADIASELGMTRQGAQQRFGR